MFLGIDRANWLTDNFRASFSDKFHAKTSCITLSGCNQLVIKQWTTSENKWKANIANQISNRKNILKYIHHCKIFDIICPPQSFLLYSQWKWSGLASVP